MRSSTSSSNAEGFVRAVPRGNWPVSCVIAIVFVLLVTAVWELRVRGMGYRPSVNETSDLWARERSRLDRPGIDMVIIGSSRAQFDFDLKTFADYFSIEPPVQLAMPGTNPMQLLESVAAAEKFSGTVVLGVTPALWFVPEGMPVEQARQAVGRYENWSPSQRAGLALSIPLQRLFAYQNQEDLKLGELLARIPIKNRPAAEANQPPLLPPYFTGIDGRRQARMWEQCDFGSPLALEIQRRWLGLFKPPPPPPGVTPEELQQMFGAFIEANLERLRVAVETLRSRGSRVVFVRLPSTGTLREIELGMAPREAFYERMLAVTGAPGVHFQDYPELSDFDCPEWSHLTASDAVLFTQRLMPILENALVNPAPVHRPRPADPALSPDSAPDRGNDTVD